MTLHYMKKSLLLWSLIFLTSLGSQAQFFDFINYSSADNELPESQLSNGDITMKNMTFANDSILWIGTYRDGLYKWLDTKSPLEPIVWETVVVTNPITPGKENYNIIRTNSPYVFFTEYNSFTKEHVGFYRLKDSLKLTQRNLTLIETVGFDSAAPVLPPIHDIALMGDSLMLLATDSGLVITNGIDIWRRRNKDNVANITEWRIDATTATSKGGIYLASGNEIYRQIGVNWERINLGEEPYKLRNTQVKELRTGPGDTIWAITPKGIAKIHDTTGYSELNADIKPLLNEVKDVAFDSIGNPWMIFELNGGVKFLDESSGKEVWRFINSTNSDLPDELSCIQADWNGRIWLGTDEDGAFKYQFFTPASVAEPWPADVQVFPTLSNTGSIRVLNESNTELPYAVTGIDGKTVAEGSLREQMELQLQSGIYILSVSRGSKTFIRKIVVL